MDRYLAISTGYLYRFAPKEGSYDRSPQDEFWYQELMPVKLGINDLKASELQKLVNRGLVYFEDTHNGAKANQMSPDIQQIIKIAESLRNRDLMIFDLNITQATTGQSRQITLPFLIDAIEKKSNQHYGCYGFNPTRRQLSSGEWADIVIADCEAG